MKFKVKTDQGTFKITQSAGDLKAGHSKGGDYSRISAYKGKNSGVHTGSHSETLSRHGKQLRRKSGQ
jgi:hypothetical protein